MKTKKFYCVFGYEINFNSDDLADLLARFSSVERCYRYIAENSSWLSKKYSYYHITESVTVCFGQITDYCD